MNAPDEAVKPSAAEKAAWTNSGVSYFKGAVKDVYPGMKFPTGRYWYSSVTTESGSRSGMPQAVKLNGEKVMAVAYLSIDQLDEPATLRVRPMAERLRAYRKAMLPAEGESLGEGVEWISEMDLVYPVLVDGREQDALLVNSYLIKVEASGERAHYRQSESTVFLDRGDGRTTRCCLRIDIRLERSELGPKKEVLLGAAHIGVSSRIFATGSESRRSAPSELRAAMTEYTTPLEEEVRMDGLVRRRLD